MLNASWSASVRLVAQDLTLELEGPEVLGVKGLVCRAEEEAGGLGKGDPLPAFEESVGTQTARGSLLATMWRVGWWRGCSEVRRPVGPGN